jgi:hypothetical protein
MLQGTGHSSATHGYQAGWGAQIFKFSFATNGNASLVGNMSVYHEGGGGASSEDNGYHLGGYAPGNAVSMIEKFSFQTDTSYGNIGSLTVHRQYYWTFFTYTWLCNWWATSNSSTYNR